MHPETLNASIYTPSQVYNCAKWNDKELSLRTPGHLSSKFQNIKQLIFTWNRPPCLSITCSSATKNRNNHWWTTTVDWIILSDNKHIAKFQRDGQLMKNMWQVDWLFIFILIFIIIICWKIGFVKKYLLLWLCCKSLSICVDVLSGLFSEAVV